MEFVDAYNNIYYDCLINSLSLLSCTAKIEFGVGGKFDNGGRFDLRLPYAEQGWVDEDAGENNFFGNLFGGGKKKKVEEEPVVEEPPEPKKNGFWPF